MDNQIRTREPEVYCSSSTVSTRFIDIQAVQISDTDAHLTHTEYSEMSLPC